MSLFPDSVYETGVVAEQGVLDDGSDPADEARVWPSLLLLHAVALHVEILSSRQTTGGRHGGIPWDLC